MSHVLVIDDDLGTLDTFEAVLRHAGFDVLTAPTGRLGLSHAAARGVDLALVDLRLPDLSGLEVLRRLRNTEIPVVMMTGFGSIATAIEATRLGAADYVEKPLFEPDLLEVIHRTLALSKVAGETSIESIRCPASERWARLVVEGTRSVADPRTVDEWARLVAIAPATLRSRCAALGYSAKTSLDFLRVLRAVQYGHRSHARAEVFLDADPRSLLHWLEELGVDPAIPTAAVLSTTESFLQLQGFVTDETTLALLRRMLRRNSPDKEVSPL